MSFTGAFVQTRIGANTNKLEGATLAAGAAGVIGSFGDAGAEVQLPANSSPIDANTQVETHQTGAAGTPGPIQMAIAGVPLRITLTNQGAGATSALRLILRHEHSIGQ
jgi:hypothetical protein